MISLLDANVKKRARQQRAILAASPVLALAGGEGMGIEAAVIAEARDPLLDAQIQAEASVAASLAAQQSNLQHAGTCLDGLISFSAAPNGLVGLDAGLSNLFGSYASLSKDPDSVPLRRTFVGNAQDVAARFNRAASRLSDLKNDLNASIQQDVVRANQNLNDIVCLNQQIMEAQASGGRIGALADQRTLCLQSLSARANLIANLRADGGVNVSIGGVIMISGGRTPDSLATYPDKDQNLRIQAQNAGTPLKLAGGGIAGKMAARDGALANLQLGLDNLASQLITRFNAIYGSDRDFFAGSGASDLSVNSTIAHDPSLLRTAGVAAVPALETFGRSYAQTVSDLGHTLSRVNDDLINSLSVTQMLANERESPRSVSIQEEQTDLQRYQQACATSDKMHATLDALPPMQ